MTQNIQYCPLKRKQYLVFQAYGLKCMKERMRLSHERQNRTDLDYFGTLHVQCMMLPVQVFTGYCLDIWLTVSVTEAAIMSNSNRIE